MQMKYRIAIAVAIILMVAQMVLADDQTDAQAAISAATAAKTAAVTAQTATNTQQGDETKHLNDVTTRYSKVSAAIMKVPADQKAYTDALSWVAYYQNLANSAAKSGVSCLSDGDIAKGLADNSYNSGQYAAAIFYANTATSSYNGADSWYDGSRKGYITSADSWVFAAEKIVQKYEGN